ncbi:MAG: TAXI family TRAP transporter solute-binding subunit [Candidatus Eiseniibacteriota bacterium]
MKSGLFAAAAVLSASLAMPALAQTVGIGTSNPGSIYHSSGSAIAKVVNEKAGIKATIQPYASPNVYLPAVNSGDLQFGLCNVYEATLAYEGTEYFKGRPNKDIRAVAIMYPLRVALFVKKDSPIQKIADFKGKPMPDGFTSQKIILLQLDATYATAGMTRKDIKPVQVPNVVAGAEAFMSGKTDAFYFALGSAKVREADAAVGGIRAIDIPNTPANLAAMQKHYPVAYLRAEKPGPANPGVLAPIHAMAYDGVVVASSKTPDDVVYKFTKAMYENKADMAQTFPVFNLFDQKEMAKKEPFPYHPGAIKFYKEKGLWPPK